MWLIDYAMAIHECNNANIYGEILNASLLFEHCTTSWNIRTALRKVPNFSHVS